jgi:hypothetical protein
MGLASAELAASQILGEKPVLEDDPYRLSKRESSPF